MIDVNAAPVDQWQRFVRKTSECAVGMGTVTSGARRVYGASCAKDRCNPRSARSHGDTHSAPD